MILAMTMLMLAMPLLWASSSFAGGDAPQAVLTKSGSGHGGDDDGDDNSGPGAAT